MSGNKKTAAIKGAVLSLSRGGAVGMVCLADAVIFALASVWFRKEFLQWEHLVLVGVLAVVCGVCFAVVPTMLYASKREDRVLRVFIGALAFFEVVLWALLTAIQRSVFPKQLPVAMTFMLSSYMAQV